jgi:hypothetical protein
MNSCKPVSTAPSERIGTDLLERLFPELLQLRKKEVIFTYLVRCQLSLQLNPSSPPPSHCERQARPSSCFWNFIPRKYFSTVYHYGREVLLVYS